MSESEHSQEQAPSVTTYLVVFVALMLLLTLTVGISFVDFGRYINNSVAMAIAVIKALLIIVYFMHMRYQPRVTWFFAGAGFLWLGIMLVLSSSDYLTRNHPRNMSPKGEPEFLSTDRPVNSPAPYRQ